MWSPTHIQVTVQKAKGLLTKGKHGTNNCFVTIGLGKERFQTSVKEKAEKNVEWHEECELIIPDHGNRAELILTCLHQNSLGLDEFLGQVTLPLNSLDFYDRPRSKWYKLESKPGKEKKAKERGELEARIAFIVKSGSLSDLSKKEKHKSSIGQLASSVGGSLLSIGTIEKRKGIKKFAKSMGSKLHLNSKKKNKENIDEDSFNGSLASLGTPTSVGAPTRFGQRVGDADPGVISEDEDEFVFDNLSQKSSGSSLNIRGIPDKNPLNISPLLTKEEASMRSRTLPPIKPPRNASDQKLDEWESKLYGKHLDIGSTDSLKRRSWENSRIPLSANSEVDNGVKEESELIAIPLDNSSAKDFQVTKPESSESISYTNYIPEEKLQLPNTAPSTPVLNKSRESLPSVKELGLEHNSSTNNIKNQPKPMPRSATMESLHGNNISPNIDAKSKTDKKSRFTSKLKFKRDKFDGSNEDSGVFNRQKVSERIIIGHENDFLKSPNHSRSEVSPELVKKYDGKSREELMLIANGMEIEVLRQRNKVKELEDYLDNLLLRVMETHPKILQNPYSRNTSTKRYIADNPIPTHDECSMKADKFSNGF